VAFGAQTPLFAARQPHELTYLSLLLPFYHESKIPRGKLGSLLEKSGRIYLPAGGSGIGPYQVAFKKSLIRAVDPPPTTCSIPGAFCSTLRMSRAGFIPVK
jgi:hypothetical protein